MKYRMTKAQKRAYARKYYLEHREKMLNYTKARYKHKRDGKCIVCGKDLSDMPSRMYRYCNKCINDKEKVSRQARWYRKKHKVKIKKEKNK